MIKLTKRALMISAALGTAYIAAPSFAADKIVIGFSQASSNSAHRNTMTTRNQEYATANFADSDLVVTNAEGKSAKQISDVESLMVQGMKVLMISAQDGAAIAPTIKQVMAAGIPVITLERSLDTPVTLHVGPHNKPIGVLAGNFIKEKLAGKGNVVDGENVVRVGGRCRGVGKDPADPQRGAGGNTHRDVRGGQGGRGGHRAIER